MRWSLRHFYKILRWHLVREYLEALYTLYWRPREGELWLQKYMTVEGWSGFHNPILIHPHIWDHSMRSRTFAIQRSVKAYQQWWQSPNKESTLPNMANMVHCEQTTWTTLLISNVSCHVLGSFPLMSTPTMALPSSPLHIEGTCKPLHTSLTNYSPPALWHWVHSQDLQPTKSTIDTEWYKCHLDIYKDNLSYTSPTTFLHPHFCLNSVDCSLTYHEGISDIWDAVSTYIHHTSSLADFCLQGCCNGPPTSYISVSPFGLSGIHQCQYIGPTFTLRPLHQGCSCSFLAGPLSQRRLLTLCGESLLCPMSCNSMTSSTRSPLIVDTKSILKHKKSW